ncbi:MAG TPA: FAD-binding oxidoreductase, partial [Prolixibacteraceae bacterium]|nr:FAD-binding oxidoreductase [Prolixibacteraceae bacterium]
MLPEGKYKILYQLLRKTISSGRIFHDPLYTLAFGTDASYFRMIPKLVVRAENEGEVSFILKECVRLSIPLTFRAAGTSLSGQAVTDSVLLIAGNHWRKFRVEENGLKIRLQPGLTGERANKLLLPYGRKIGPDPASISSAMIGGIAANNASGMCCGTAENSYKTLHSMRMILADGTLLDTGDTASKEQFYKTHPQFIRHINALVADVKANPELKERIARKFKMKNTTGYSLNALVDFDDPFEVIQHLMIGSEGTLGFISEITYRTVIEHPCKASSLMVFPDIKSACTAVSLLKSSPVSAVELIDRAGLRSVEDQKGMPAWLHTLSAGATAILVETRASSKDILDNQIQDILEKVKAVPSEIPVSFTAVPAEYDQFWKIRKGLF